ncbi:MAG: hypothetical protein MJ202_07095 [Lentisphaeria bacterium]|nr:hypothetical protein [Lentisphaeria bacterium]
MTQDIKFASGNSNLSNFVNFFKQAQEDSGAIVQMKGDSIVQYAKLEKSSDHYGKVFRSKAEITNNNKARTLLYNSIADYFGGEKYIPDTVKEVMHLNKFGLAKQRVNGKDMMVATSGKPLTASRIDKILNEVRNVTLQDPKLYAKNFVTLMLAIPKNKIYDVEYQDKEMSKQADLFFDRMFPPEAFKKVTKEQYKEIVNRDHDQELNRSTPGEDLRYQLKCKLNSAVEAFKNGEKNWTKQIGDIIHTATRVLTDEKSIKWCKDVLKEIDTYYDTAPLCEPKRTNAGSSSLNRKLDKAMAKVLRGEGTDEVKKNGKIWTTGDFKTEIDSSELHPCKENPFEYAVGDTAAIAQEVKKKIAKNYADGKVPPNAITIQIAADRRHCIGEAFSSDANTQEESVVRQMDPESLSPLAKHVEQHVETKDKYFFYKSGEGTPDVTDGMILPTTAAYADYKQVEEPFDLQLLFDAMPSFSVSEVNFDPAGALCYLKKSWKKQNTDKEMTAEMESNAKKIIEAIQSAESKVKYPEIRKATQNVNPKFKDLMMLFMFAGQNDKFDVFSSNTQKQVDKIYQLIQSGDYQDLLATAKENYEKALSDLMKGWVTMARERGTKYFLGTAIGCSAFGNDPKVVARLMAEAFVKYGGDMKFVFCQYREPAERQLFEAAFAKAYQEAQDKGSYRNVFRQEYNVKSGQESNARNGVNKKNLLIVEEEPEPVKEPKKDFVEKGEVIANSEIRNALPKKDISWELLRTAPRKSARKIFDDIEKIAKANDVEPQEKANQAERYLRDLISRLFKEDIANCKSVEEFIDQMNIRLAVSNDAAGKSIFEKFVAGSNEGEWNQLDEGAANGASAATKPQEAKGKLILNTFAKCFAGLEGDDEGGADRLEQGRMAFKVFLRNAFVGSKAQEGNLVSVEDYNTFLNEIGVEAPKNEALLS